MNKKKFIQEYIGKRKNVNYEKSSYWQIRILYK